MDLSKNSAVRSSESKPQPISIQGIARLCSGGEGLAKHGDSQRAVRFMGRWSSLLLLLLLGGLAEAGLGRVSLAQVNAEAGLEPSAKPVVIDPAQAIESVDAATTAPKVPTAPTVNPEAIVIPRAEESLDELGEAESGAENIAPPAVEDMATPEQPSKLDTNAAEEVTPEQTEIVSPNPLETETAEVEAEAAETEETEAEIEETAEVEATERVYLAEKQISFVPPVGFTAMSLEEIQAKFPGAMPPSYAYANEARDVSVGITVSDIPLEAEQLPEVKRVLEDFLESSVPGFQWLEHDFVNLGGQDWIKLEFISQTQDQRIHNDMYITSLQGKLLGFNFNANLAVDFARRDLLQASRNSILLNETVASDD